jgi:hypothetical protein
MTAVSPTTLLALGKRNIQLELDIYVSGTDDGACDADDA